MNLQSSGWQLLNIDMVQTSMDSLFCMHNTTSKVVKVLSTSQPPDRSAKRISGERWTSTISQKRRISGVQWRHYWKTKRILFQVGLISANPKTSSKPSPSPQEQPGIDPSLELYWIGIRVATGEYGCVPDPKKRFNYENRPFFWWQNNFINQSRMHSMCIS